MKDIGFKPIAQRTVNAENAFIDYVMNLHNTTKEDAEKVLRVFRKLKVVKMDFAMGRLNVIHGAYFDLGAINNAIRWQE